jgi:hypothetical protein
VTHRDQAVNCIERTASRKNKVLEEVGTSA